MKKSRKSTTKKSAELLLFKVSFTGFDTIDKVVKEVSTTYKSSGLEPLYNHIAKTFTGVAYKSITQLV